MDKKEELIIVRALVKDILEQDIRARNSDSYLYLKVLNTIALHKGFDLTSVSIADFLMNMSEWGFPPFSSVGRTRRRLVHDFPELSACKEVQAVRDENEVVFEEFARGEF